MEGFRCASQPSTCSCHVQQVWSRCQGVATSAGEHLATNHLLWRCQHSMPSQHAAHVCCYETKCHQSNIATCLVLKSESSPPPISFLALFHCLLQVFVEALIVGAPRLMMLMQSDVQKGPYQAGKPATHTGKIIYPQCKKGVWPPSDWNPAVAQRSAKLPEIKLELQFVHGYDG